MFWKPLSGSAWIKQTSREQQNLQTAQIASFQSLPVTPVQALPVLPRRRRVVRENVP